MSVRTPFAYMVIAGICIALHNVVIILSDRVGIRLGLAVLLSFCVVASTGYVLHSVFTFRRPLAPITFARYVIAMVANIPLAFVTIWFWHQQAGLPMVFASPLASVCMLALNFLLGRWAIATPNRWMTGGP
ncbi:GtrA family protein [Mesorhizobium sp. WSM3873]|uniref:GtrA family protein n=1 Tax=Mesorhizobium sp. WSM3873 TaxID=1854056 RepID=UPI0007FC982A|nr:GtrA family protein [Mesorhizobium sp. WSM3873]OBQ80358.1 hypothetical protein A9K71_05990 [Mesorhizobium sp. WSM3873]